VNRNLQATVLKFTCIKTEVVVGTNVSFHFSKFAVTFGLTQVVQEIQASKCLFWILQQPILRYLINNSFCASDSHFVDCNFLLILKISDLTCLLCFVCLQILANKRQLGAYRILQKEFL